MERRTFNRVIFSTHAKLASLDKSWQTEIIDLSLKGALLATPTGLTVDSNTTYNLQFKLEGLEQPIRMQGKIRHANQQLLGFQCELIDIDSATELRRLIELNLSDERLLHRDLAALLAN
jgi:hypothetical protein